MPEFLLCSLVTVLPDYLIRRHRYLYLHMVDAVGIVHAIILRIKTLMMPVKLLVFASH